MRIRRNPRRRPSHPGAMLRDMVLPPLGICKTRLARRLERNRFEAGNGGGRLGAIVDGYASHVR